MELRYGLTNEDGEEMTQKEVADSQHCEYVPLDPDTML